ncbi:MAG: ADP-ribosylglycohydrolase family protein [Bacteroides sp.]|nr:ADP-ribosylglycohydrolase family protein [Bacteroides sp.]MCM1413954.1 ADP-ribosylglycohydrolase family protein [Bacteroides sp.]MCM1471829.1 ADP-ribosylglycohydrolase family protein [Bacteroides sp.]
MSNEKISRVDRARMVVRGAVCGDIVGSAYEFRPTKEMNFQLLVKRSRFTDDTVCTIAVTDALMSGYDFRDRLLDWCRRYLHAGYGRGFFNWITARDPQPYDSWGNGSAMRVSAVGAYAKSEDEVLDLALKTAEVTHNHPEGIKGAQATALAIYMALNSCRKDEIRQRLETQFGYDLSRRYADIQPDYRFRVSCQQSVPEAIIAFLGADDYESTIRRAVALGGDADTQACISGGIAAAYYGTIPQTLLDGCMSLLPEQMINVIEKFDKELELRNE